MDSYQRQGSKNRILSKEQISQVNEYALKLMEDVGCRVSCEEALKILGRAGCDVGNPERVKISRKLVMEAIEVAPGEIEVFDRNGYENIGDEDFHLYVIRLLHQDGRLEFKEEKIR